MEKSCEILKVVHRPGQCIHNGYTGKLARVSLADKMHAVLLPAGKPIVRIVEKPLKSTISIWSREAAASIQYLDSSNERKPMS